MGQMRLIFIFNLGLFFILHLQPTNASAPVFFQIDEFIKQLMSSGKFDELTDVIADKAAQKIKSMDKTTQSLSLTMRKQEEDIHFNPKEKNKFEKKPAQNTHWRSDNVQSKHVKIKTKDSNSDENGYEREPKKLKDFDPMKGNTHNSDEINKDSQADKKHQAHNKNNHENIKTSDSERNNISPGRNNNANSRSGEEIIVPTEQTHTNKWHGEQLKKSLRSNENKPHGNNIITNTKYETKLDKLNRIDTLALLSSHMNSKELELNFKHLKGKVEAHVGKEKTVIHNERKHTKEDNVKTTNKYEYQNAEDVNIKNKRKNVSSTQLSERSSAENKKHEQSEYDEPLNIHERDHDHSMRDTQLRSKYSYENDSEHKESRIIEKNKKHSSNEKPITRVRKPPNDSEEVNNTDDDLSNAKLFIDKVMDRVSKELKNATYTPNKKRQAFNETKPHSWKHTDDSEIIHSDSLETPNRPEKNIPNQRKIFREEKGRQFTYQSSAEYAEYHENLANAPKPKYFNTY